MALIKCRECNHEISNQEKICPNCGALKKTWPLTNFTRFYFIGGFVFVMLYALVFDPDLLAYLAAVWLLIGIGLGLIVYGRGRKRLCGPSVLTGYCLVNNVAFRGHF
ncbi:MAG: zinc ribbon domain-containing protein [Proteobacteria bacterium]|nr:zinc ribbon domain-containing protein [Pseudomonadota bacterium]